MDTVDLCTVVVTVPRVLVDPIRAFAEVLVERCGALERAESTFEDAEVAFEKAADAVVRGGCGVALTMLEPGEEVVEVDGVPYRRMRDATPGKYFTRRGEVEVTRHLYRRIGVHNGPTIVPLELKAGIVDGRWTPKAGAAVAHLLQGDTSRDAKALCEAAGILPYSRSSLQRGANDIGARWEQIRAGAEESIMEEFEVSAEAKAVSFGLDRVAVPMDERAEGNGVAFRMAYAAVWTLHDGEGKPLYSARYGRMPEFGSGDVEECLRGDVRMLLHKRNDLRVVALCDGAPEMQLALKRVGTELSVEVDHVLDFWHVTEKLAEAARSVGRDPKAELRELKRLLLEEPEGAAKVELVLRGWARAHDGSVPEHLASALGYVKRNRHRMPYARLREAKLPIGSGHVEATCKTLVSTRMKRSGARWTTEGGQAILGLRALAKSSRWDAAMKHVVASYTAAVMPRAA